MRRIASMICASMVAICILLAVSPARTWGQYGSPTQVGLFTKEQAERGGVCMAGRCGRSSVVLIQSA